MMMVARKLEKVESQRNDQFVENPVFATEASIFIESSGMRVIN